MEAASECLLQLNKCVRLSVNVHVRSVHQDSDLQAFPVLWESVSSLSM